ncbi:hypothetical protein DOK76_09105 [Vagococcus sp. DIV0080]|uniref:Uncharacterized protein n=1 Tax=Candidatus Vagococcus giribetii TaxID=2230876 RepID=A0ABS3HV38_9ENTE|nr:hypothetical protein [Vagococcus sp. DIV0080]MBO0477230.1 hypothetical protein [Vagococcus sp. DIV0080]
MSKSGKFFWLMMSVIFAVGAVVAGTMYDSKRKKQLDVTVVTPTYSSEKGTPKKTEKNESKNTEKKQTKQSEGTNQSSSQKETTDLTNAELAAQGYIDVIIINGQVQSDFTLDDYHAAKNAVDALSESAKKTDLQGQIQQIETALTNMGIAY